jgi:hypothetical protein
MASFKTIARNSYHMRLLSQTATFPSISSNKQREFTYKHCNVADLVITIVLSTNLYELMWMRVLNITKQIQTIMNINSCQFSTYARKIATFSLRHINSQRSPLPCVQCCKLEKAHACPCFQHWFGGWRGDAMLMKVCLIRIVLVNVSNLKRLATFLSMIVFNTYRGFTHFMMRCCGLWAVILAKSFELAKRFT